MVTIPSRRLCFLIENGLEWPVVRHQLSLVWIDKVEILAGEVRVRALFAHRHHAKAAPDTELVLWIVCTDRSGIND